MLSILKRFSRKTPLAWHQIMKQKPRLAVALAGIAFADILMFIQMGMLEALYDSATQPHRLLQTDLVLLNPQTKSILGMPSFPRQRLYQAKSYESVAAVSALYSGTGSWRNPESRIDRELQVFGVDPKHPPFTFLQDSDQLEQLKLLNRGLFDQLSNEKFGPIPNLIQAQGKVTTEVNNRQFHAVGVFSLGASFGAEGNLVTGTSSFLTLFPDRSPNQIDIGIVQLQPGVDAVEVQAQLQSGLPTDVKVLTKAEFIELERQYWGEGGTGFIFNLGAVVGFIVGTVIVYQILYTDVSDHLPEYATLKAMGYSDRYLTGVLAQEILVLAVLGFIPGFVLSLGLYQITYAATALPVVMKVGRAIVVFSLTLVMCSGSGLIALGKLRSADPADIF